MKAIDSRGRVRQSGGSRRVSFREVNRASANPRLGTRGRPEESRAAILRAAVGEFAEHGIAGARTDAIARAAHVNKALLYYYFKDKDALYEAVLDFVFSGLRDRVMPVLDSDLPPREKMLKYLGAKARTPMERIAREHFLPIFEKVTGVLREGIQRGEFRPVNPLDFLPSVVGMIIFYFSSAPLMKMVVKIDPLSPERIRERRVFVLEFISAALFT